LGLEGQTRKFAEQGLRFRERQAQLLRRKPSDTTFKPANLDRLHLAPAASGLELKHPLHDRLLPTEETIFPVPRRVDQNFSTPGFALAVAPLGEICPDRATPELTELTARLGSMMPYRQAASVMAEFLPI
jgi:hypothetical protein